MKNQNNRCQSRNFQSNSIESYIFNFPFNPELVCVRHMLCVLLCFIVKVYIKYYHSATLQLSNYLFECE